MYFQTKSLKHQPDLLRLHQYKPDRYPFYLASTTNSSFNGRFDILFAFPGDSVSMVNGTMKIDNVNLKSDEKSFLKTLKYWWSTFQIDTDRTPEDLPFTGGWFVFLAYELATEIEPTLRLPENHTSLPEAYAVHCPAAVIFDHKKNKATIVCENEYEPYINDIEKDCVYTGNQFSENESKDYSIENIHEDDEEPYLDKVLKIKKYILEGDIFQANLSRGWSLTLDKKIESTDLFKNLETSNPGSFSALIKINDTYIISSSPERLVSVKNYTVETRPIAGTRPRSDYNVDDKNLAEDLLSNHKERAEHIMLIDLERNDLGRICKSGSIHVNEFMTLESFEHVHHIVSNVKGDLQEGISPADVIQAVFPGGTITGCPKVRCMEILAEMEQQPRGAYTGSVGYINRNGDMDLNILIRTMIRDGENITFRAGGGIVADSDPEHELEETRAKAKGLLKALQVL